MHSKARAYLSQCASTPHPGGLGGYLVEDDKIVAYFSVSIGKIEQRLLSIDVADCACQQTVEALAVLVALRCWKHRWRGKPIFLGVKSDSISALDTGGGPTNAVGSRDLGPSNGTSGISALLPTLQVRPENRK